MELLEYIYDPAGTPGARAQNQNKKKDWFRQQQSVCS
jgi:hypothetical protein